MLKIKYNTQADFSTGHARNDKKAAQMGSRAQFWDDNRGILCYNNRDTNGVAPVTPGRFPLKERRVRMNYYVYSLSNGAHTTRCTGVTDDLLRRVYEH